MKKWLLILVILTASCKLPEIPVNENIKANPNVKVIFTFKMSMADSQGYIKAYPNFIDKYPGFLTDPNIELFVAYTDSPTSGNQIDYMNATIKDKDSNIVFNMTWNGVEGKPFIPIVTSDAIFPGFFKAFEGNFIDTYTIAGWQYKNGILFKPGLSLSKEDEIIEGNFHYSIFWQDGIGMKWKPSINGLWNQETTDLISYETEISFNTVIVRQKQNTTILRAFTAQIFEQDGEYFKATVIDNENWPDTQGKTYYFRQILDQNGDLFFMWDLSNYPTMLKFFHRIN